MLTRRVLLAAFALVFVLPSAAHAQVPLTAERFAALDTALTEFIPLSAARVSSEDYDAARTACRSLDSADPLLNPLRKACTASVRYDKAFDAFADCESRRRCFRTARRARIAVNAVIRRERDANGAAKAAGLVEACYSVLRTTRSQLRLLARTSDFLRLAQRVVRTQSRKLSRRLLRRGRSIDRAANKEPSATQQREDFREACAPPAA